MNASLTTNITLEFATHKRLVPPLFSPVALYDLLRVATYRALKLLSILMQRGISVRERSRRMSEKARYIKVRVRSAISCHPAARLPWRPTIYILGSTRSRTAERLRANSCLEMIRLSLSVRGSVLRVARPERSPTNDWHQNQGSS